jgi:beta-lactamase regulating signal transducer with metallopeptidase domain
MHVVLNWIAQGAVVSLAAAAVLRMIPRSRTQARYWFVWAALVVVLALPALPLIFGTAPTASLADGAPAPFGPVVSVPDAWWTSTSLAIGAWLIWCAISSGHLIAGTLTLRRLRRRCRECPTAVEARLTHWLGVKSTGRRTRVMLSGGIRSAAVLGCGSPIIALSPSLLEHLSDPDLDRIVVHEWAHVQRRDDVARPLQLVMRTIIGWHPAIWWLDRQLELEREVACDEMAIAVTGSSKRYAACLTTLAALRVEPLRSLPVTGASSSGLSRRIVRILAAHHVVSAPPWRAIAMGASVTLAALACAVANVRLVESATESLPLAAQRPAPTTANSTTTSDLATGRAAPSSPPSRFDSADDRMTPAQPGQGASAGVAPPAATTVEHRSNPPVTTAATPNVEPLRDAAAIATDTRVHEAAIIRPVEARVTTPALSALPSAPVAARPPWTIAADAGIAIGRGSQSAGLATAGFFTRFGKRVAGSF